MNGLKHILICSMMAIMTLLAQTGRSQDMIVTSNGMKFKAKVVAVEEDSVKYTNKFDPTGTVLTVPKSQLSYIEYGNGEFDFFEGSYKNLSSADTIKFITGIADADETLMVEGISFSIDNFFTENHFVVDFSSSLDSSLNAEKGRIEFEFDNMKYNFSMRSYKAGNKTLYSKFTKGYASSEKRYRRLSEKMLARIRIFSGDAMIEISLSPSNAAAMRELFRKIRID